jgi:hypothetical protein
MTRTSMQSRALDGKDGIDQETNDEGPRTTSAEMLHNTPSIAEMVVVMKLNE